jgi:hypothetical protein
VTVQHGFFHEDVAGLNQKWSLSSEGLCLPVVGLEQHLDFLTDLEAIFYGHLVVNKQSTYWFQKFELGWLMDH